MAIPNLFMCAQNAPKDFHFHEELSSPMQCKTWGQKCTPRLLQIQETFPTYGNVISLCMIPKCALNLPRNFPTNLFSNQPLNLLWATSDLFCDDAIHLIAHLKFSCWNVGNEHLARTWSGTWTVLLTIRNQQTHIKRVLICRHKEPSPKIIPIVTI